MGDDVTFPVPRETARGADLLVIERWADRQRAELVRLIEELRQLDERLVVLEEEAPAAEPPATFLAAVDGMLETAMERLDGAVEAVHAEADRILDFASRDAEALLRQHGAGDDVVERLTDPAPRVIRQLRRPRSALELWQDLTPSSRLPVAPAGPAPIGPDGPMPGAGAAAPLLEVREGGSSAGQETAPLPQATPGVELIAATDPVAAPAAPPIPATEALGSSIGLRDMRSWGPSHLHVNDQFWAALPPDRPVRERLRRFAQRSPQ